MVPVFRTMVARALLPMVPVVPVAQEVLLPRVPMEPVVLLVPVPCLAVAV